MPVPLGGRSTTFSLPDKSWVLRNLSENEFVRLDAIVSSSRPEAFHAPFMYGLGKLFLYHMTWTDDGSGVLKSCHGMWAGHHFDVTALIEVVADTDGN
jgi:hypothetical protein